MAQEKTPGVFIAEQPAFPNSVVEVATGVPAFLGYTEYAKDGAHDLAGTPRRISSLREFATLFGSGPKRRFKRVIENGAISFKTAQQDFYLFNALRLYFDNGGGPCWIVSVGKFEADSHSAADFSEEVWKAVAREPEPAIYVVPDAVALGEDDYKAISEEMLTQCQELGSRVAILDIFDGANRRVGDAINGPGGFRNKIVFPDRPSYGMVYYPWLNTTIVEAADVTYTWLDDHTRGALADEIKDQIKKAADAQKKQANPDLLTEVDAIRDMNASAADVTRTHNALMTMSDAYRQAMAGLLTALNVLPPSAAMAGVFARTDATLGVFKAPANTGIASVVSPTVSISDDQQEDLNVPLDGRAVNAIRTFIGRGVLIWGARTLDGNSQDYRYINVRRTLIMLEQSIFYAAQAYVFEPNVAGTWKTVQTMIENFLNNQWKTGALAGATPAEAYGVSVGLGSAMTGNDILDGYMRVTVRVAISRPAEFIVITFAQKMQTSS